MNSKLQEELRWWRKYLKLYGDWFNGVAPLEGKPCPEKGKYPDPFTAWIRGCLEPTYGDELGMGPDELEGLEVLEIGPGPLSGMGYFKGMTLTGVDPLRDEYVKLGYPVDPNVVKGSVEKLPFADDTFDAVISVNSLDHVDDFELAAKEINRVIKPDGKLAFSVDQHPPLVCEPIELTDEIVKKAFPGIKKIKERDSGPSHVVRVLWKRNF